MKLLKHIFIILGAVSITALMGGAIMTKTEVKNCIKEMDGGK